MFDPRQQDAIFIQIASYRDTELPKTIQAAIDSSDHPEKLSFGVVHQFGPETRHLLDKFRGRPGFRLIELPWQESRGVGVARNLCGQLYCGERWTLQIDAHTYFEPGWDTDLLRQWRLCDDDRAILSTYPAPFTYDGKGMANFTTNGNRLVKLHANKFFYRNIPVFGSSSVDERKLSKPIRTPFVSGGFVFGLGSMCSEVPYYREAVFMGEEIARALQLYTNGYNIYSPIGLKIYHHYNRNSHNFWKDMKLTDSSTISDIYDNMTRISYDFLHDLLIGEKWSKLGFARRIDDFQLYAGVNFQLKRISKNQKDKLEPPFETDPGWVLTDRAVNELA